MEARRLHAALLAAILLSLGASHRTQNFIVTAPTAEFAKTVAETAEIMRRELAIEWLGQELPPWQDPCPITVQVGPQLGAGGATSFMFNNGRPYGWRMSIQGSRERVLDSVLPHEIMHTIFATHFGRPLPRWADEGACTTVEYVSERRKQQQYLIQFLKTGRGIPFNKMFAMTEYPRDIMPLYSQGYSVVQFLLAQGGKRTFVEYLGVGMKSNNWTAATHKFYGYESLSQLQVEWLDWVRNGSGDVMPRDTLVAQADNQRSEDGRRQGGAPVNSVQPVGYAREVPGRSAEVSREPEAGSWYARQRDQHLAGKSAEGSTAAGHGRTDGLPAAAAEGNRSTDPNTATGDERSLRDTAVTRPQAIQQPGQVILQWSSPPRPSQPLAPVPGGRQPPRPAAAPQNSPPSSASFLR